MIRSLLLEGGKVTDGLDPKDWKAAAARPGAVLWIDVEAPKRKTTKLLKDAFNFDDISLQDCLTFSLLPKFDAFPDYAFIVIHALGYDEASGSMTSREVDVFLGRGYIVTVHVDPITSLEKVYKEAQRSGEVLARGPALVAHVLFDRLIDLAYEMVSSFDDDIEQMEERISHGQLEGIVEWTLRVRRQLLLMKKTIGPQRDVLNELARGDSPLVPKEATIHFRDDYDRLARVFDQVDTNRELVATAAEGYRSMVALQMNEISLRTNASLERLTLIATVFLPVTAVASWYGMNFTNMPELTTSFFYPMLFLIMVGVSAWIWWSFREELAEVRKAERIHFLPEHTHAAQDEHDHEAPKRP
jgi:magnesium transporter